MRDMLPYMGRNKTEATKLWNQLPWWRKFLYTVTGRGWTPPRLIQYQDRPNLRDQRGRKSESNNRRRPG